MCIILKLVCETFSRITVKISFQWGHKHGVYAAASFSANVTSWCSRYDTHVLTSIILHTNIIFIAQWLSGGNSEILHGSDFFARRPKLCKPESIFKQTHVNFVYRENITSFLNYVTATLSALFAWRGSYMQLRSHAQKYNRVQSIHICIINIPCVNQRMWTGLKSKKTSKCFKNLTSEWNQK